MMIKKEDGHLSILYGGKKLMDYQYELIDVPDGVDQTGGQYG